MTDKLVSWFFKFYIALVFAFIFAPFITLVVFAFNKSRFPYLPWQGFTLEWFASLSDPSVIAAFQNSVIVAIISAAIAAPLGCMAAYFLNRWSFAGKNLYLAFVIAPPCIPLVILALTLLIYLRELGVAKTLVGVIVTHVVLAAPFALGIMRLRLAEIEPDLEKAAWNLGASEWKAIKTIVAPQAAAAGVAAFLLSMSISWDEFIIAWFVSGLDVTLPVYLWNRFQGQISAQINAIGTIAFFVSILLVIAAEVLVLAPASNRSPDTGD